VKSLLHSIGSFDRFNRCENFLEIFRYAYSHHLSRRHWILSILKFREVKRIFFQTRGQLRAVFFFTASILVEGMDNFFIFLDLPQIFWENISHTSFALIFYKQIFFSKFLCSFFGKVCLVNYFICLLTFISECVLGPYRRHSWRAPAAAGTSSSLPYVVVPPMAVEGEPYLHLDEC
jgi:hypothetical protein